MERSKSSPQTRRGSKPAPSSVTAKPAKRVGGVKPRGSVKPVSPPASGAVVHKAGLSSLGHRDLPASNHADKMKDIDYGSYYLARVVCCDRYDDENDLTHVRSRGVAFTVPCDLCQAEALELCHKVLGQLLNRGG